MISEIRFTTISTADLQRCLSLFRDVIGMEVIATQPVGGEAYEQLWDLLYGTSAESILLLQPGMPSGGIRLLRFVPVSETVIRETAEPWDTGAVKILDFMVTDFERARQALNAQGWQWRTEPQQYQLPGGEGESREGHIQGPDGKPVASRQSLVASEEPLPATSLTSDQRPA
jgi:catechol 2,3-dioxygenase-like lactoylglutathione lyase family enzyme